MKLSPRVRAVAQWMSSSESEPSEQTSMSVMQMRIESSIASCKSNEGCSGRRGREMHSDGNDVGGKCVQDAVRVEQRERVVRRGRDERVADEMRRLVLLTVARMSRTMLTVGVRSGKL